MKQTPARLMPFLLLCCLACGTAGSDRPVSDYAVVVSTKTAPDPDWKPVVDAMAAEHDARVITWEREVADALPALREQFPRYACFVARPEEATREFIAAVHRMTRRLDDDPYTDCLWGIVTGYDADAALRLARQREPLVIRRVAAATEVALEACEQGVWYSELRKNQAVRKEPGAEPVEVKGPDDTTEALADLLAGGRADLFVTSGHASEHDWRIGYGYRNGTFRCADGVLYGSDTRGGRHPIRSDSPKVYLPVGNCLMGHVDGRDCMALAFMNSAGVRQMAGYTVETWYGYAGWGMLDYFVEQPGRFTCAQAFAACDHALIHRLLTFFPDLLKVEDGFGYRGPVAVSDAARAAGLSEQDGRGLLYDRDALAFYGDPAWEARMADMPRAWEQTLSEKDGLYALEVKPNRGRASFDPVNTNGSQRGHRPIIQFLPRRLRGVRVVDDGGLGPTVTDDFVLIPSPVRCDPGRSYRVTFKAETSAGPAAATRPAVAFDTHDGYFVSNRFEPGEAVSALVAGDRPTFEGAFGEARVMRDKSHRLPANAFDSRIVLAVIHRGKAFLEYKVGEVTTEGDALVVRYAVEERKSDSAEYACPLIVSVARAAVGGLGVVRFEENGRPLKTAPIRREADSR